MQKWRYCRSQANSVEKYFNVWVERQYGLVSCFAGSEIRDGEWSPHLAVVPGRCGAVDRATTSRSRIPIPTNLLLV